MTGKEVRKNTPNLVSRNSFLVNTGFLAKLIKREMRETKETGTGLPFITKETVGAIKSQFTSGGEGKAWGEHLEEVKGRLLEDNPNLVKFIEDRVSQFPPQLHQPMFEVIVGTIAVIEHQAGVDKLSSLITPKKLKK